MRHLVFGLVMALLLYTSAVGASSNTPAFITDAATNSVLYVGVGDPVSIPVGSFPFGVTVLPDGSWVYVANFLSRSVSAIRVSDRHIETIPVGLAPMGVAASADGSRVFVTHYGNGSMAVINTETRTVEQTVVVGFLPRGVAASPTGPYAYVGNQGSDDVAIINYSTTPINVTRVPAGPDPFGVAVDPSGQVLYIALEGVDQLLIMDAGTGQFLGSVGVGDRPGGVAVSPDGLRVYVTNQGSNTVSVIDAERRTRITDIPVGVMPFGVAVTSDSSRAYVANSNSGSLSVIDTVRNVVDTTISLAGSNPIAFGFFLMPGPATITVSIDITPGSNPNMINLRSKSKEATVPVAILSSDTFDATQVNPETVMLAGAPVKKNEHNGKLMASVEDVNEDGRPDLVVHVQRDKMQLNAEDTEAVLTGEMYDHTPIRGTGEVNVIQ